MAVVYCRHYLLNEQHMAYLLVVDASTSLCSVAVQREQQSFSLVESQPRRQAQLLLPMVDELLTQAGIKKTELAGVAYGRGPGSFTGIRIAASVMQGIALALSLPVCGISSLQTLAQTVLKQSKTDYVLALMDAHMGELFWGVYARDGEICQLIGVEHVGSPEQCLAAIAEFKAAYPHGELAGNGLQQPSFNHFDQAWALLEPQAQEMLVLVQQAWDNQQFSSADQHQPVYLRESVAWKKLDEQPSLLRRK